MNIKPFTYIINDKGFQQAVDTDGDHVCDECGRFHTNLGNGTYCESCALEELYYCEQMYEDFKALDK